VRPDELIELVWVKTCRGNGQKSLQVLVSRPGTRAARTHRPRRRRLPLGAAPGEVDSGGWRNSCGPAVAVLDRDAAAAEGLAREALEMAAGLSQAADGDDGPLAEVRRAAARRCGHRAVILARASSRAGAHAAALPVLQAAHAQSPRDEPLLADLLRSEAAISGPATALERFERYRRDLRERLGADPGELLQRTHRGLLALDARFAGGCANDATELIGRDAEPGAAAGPDGQCAGGVHRRRGRPGQDAAGARARRDAAQPVVHFVELAGVTAAEDVAVEVGSVLGVPRLGHGPPGPDRRAAGRYQGPESRAARAVPSLLSLDNCEHLIEAAASSPPS